MPQHLVVAGDEIRRPRSFRAVDVPGVKQLVSDVFGPLPNADRDLEFQKTGIFSRSEELQLVLIHRLRAARNDATEWFGESDGPYRRAEKSPAWAVGLVESSRCAHYRIPISRSTRADS